VLTVAEAKQAIAGAMPVFNSETVSLENACGRTLRQTVVAERDQPPFDRVTMDGIAIRFDAFEDGRREFRIQGTQHAGDPVQTIGRDDSCIEIMTGGVLPKNADCIIPVERITVRDGSARIDDSYRADRNQYVHRQGSDHPRGFEVLRAGMRITPMEIAIIASCGLDSVQVSCRPSVRVVSTGNELVPPGSPIAPHQIRASNGPAVVAMLMEQGFADTAHEHLRDDPAALELHLGRLLGESDALILSGGVSMGKADFVPQVLGDLGVELVFHKIRQRPGKPMWFGIGPQRQAVFALPGNPVSTLVCCRHYVLPALMAASGREPTRTESARLSEEVIFEADLTCFMPVRLSYGDDGVTTATPVPTNTSGDFASLTGTDGYVELEREQNRFSAGGVVPLHRWVTP